MQQTTVLEALVDETKRQIHIKSGQVSVITNMCEKLKIKLSRWDDCNWIYLFLDQFTIITGRDTNHSHSLALIPYVFNASYSYILKATPGEMLPIV